VKVHYSIHKRLPLDVVLRQMNPVHNFMPYLRSILILSSNLGLGLASGLFLPGFLTNLI
jgi:hypothetical protein